MKVSTMERTLMTAREVSELTGIATSTLHEWAVRRENGVSDVPGPRHVQMSPRRRRWMRDDVVAWLDEIGVR